MKLIAKEIKKGIAKIEVQNLDDLWYLSTIVDPTDRITARTERKIKIGGENDRNAKVVRKKIKLTVIVEKIQFSKTTNALRISGPIAEGTDDVAAGDYHTIAIEIGDFLELDKGKRGFLTFQIDKLNEATKNKGTQILICALDRTSAHFAQLKKYGFEMISSVSGEAPKKDFKENITSHFFKDVVKILIETCTRLKITTLVIGSVAFWKDNLAKEIKATNLANIVSIIYTSCNSDGENAIREIMTMDEVKNALKNERFNQEINSMQKLLSEISKEGKAAYGLLEVSEKANIGAVEQLLVTDALIMKTRNEGSFEQLDTIMRIVDKNKGSISIISIEHEGGEQLNGLGGIAALLRY